MQETSLTDLVNMLQGAGTPLNGLVVFFLWKLTNVITQLVSKFDVLTQRLDTTLEMITKLALSQKTPQ